MTMEVLPPRNKSQRLIEKKRKQKQQLELKEKLDKQNKDKERNIQVHKIKNPQASDICTGLNELTDLIHALPQDIISYFTLLKEIEAKCVYTVPHLQAYIKRFLTMRKNHPKRGLLLSRIRDCIREIMPCLEEKMHVATIASDNVKKYINKIDQAYEIVVDKEIPEIIRIGPLWEPCMKVSEPKSLQQQRSESRREALAAKKAKNGGNGNTSTFEDDYEGTAAEDSAGPSSTKKNSKSKKESRAHNNTHNSNGNNNSHNNNNNNNNNTHNNIHNSHAGSNSTSSSKKRKNNNLDENSNNPLNNVNGNNSKKSKNSKLKKETKKESDNNQNSKNGNATANNSINTIGGNDNNTNNNDNRNKGSNGGSKARNSHKNENLDNTSHSSRTRKENESKDNNIPTSPINYEGEPVYCYCQQVSYGEMVGCDGENCEKEWFHLPCTGLKELPKGEWFCDDCKAKMSLTK